MNITHDRKMTLEVQGINMVTRVMRTLRLSPLIVNLAIVILTLGYAIVLLYPFRWEPPRLLDNGVQLSSNTFILASPGIAYSKKAPDWLLQAIRSNELAISLRVRPFTGAQYGPARILTVSKDVYARDFTIGQEGSDLIVRLRTSQSDLNGLPQLVLPGILKSLDWRTVQVSMRPGALTIIVDGAVIAHRDLSGSPLQRWNRTFRVAIGNELTGSRPWLGEISQATITVGNKSIEYTEPGILLTPKRYWSFRDWNGDLVARPTSLRDPVQNVLLFIPMGILFRCRARIGGFKRGVLAILTCGGISVFFEVLQIGFDSRHPSADDVFFNVIGATLGYLIFGYVLLRYQRKEDEEALRL